MDVINVIYGLLHSATKTPMPYAHIHIYSCTKEHETSKDIFYVS